MKKKARALTRSTNQTGTSDMSRDRKLKALAPGKRISKSGKIYYESRKNRSDVKGRDTPGKYKKVKVVKKKVASKNKWQVLTKTPKMLRLIHPTKGTLELFGERINGENRYFVSLVAKDKIADKEFSTKKASLAFAKKLMDGKIKPKAKPKKVKSVLRKSVIIGATPDRRLMIKDVTPSKTREPLRGYRRHDLLPLSVRKRLPKLYSQDGKKDPMVYLKLFSPYSNYTLYVTEFDGKDTFFGYAQTGQGSEWSYSSFKELVNASKMNGKLPLIERDMYFTPKRASKISAIKRLKR